MSSPFFLPPPARNDGNVIFFLLLAVALIGLLGVAISQGGREAEIGRETYMIRAAELSRYGTELETAVRTVTDNGASENDIRFAHPDAHANYGAITDHPEAQVFDIEGGAAAYRDAPSGINDGSRWHFFGTTAAPDIGTDRADLVAVLPNLNPEFCRVLNGMIGFEEGTQPGDAATGTNPDCVMSADTGDYFAGDFADPANVMDEASFSFTPAPRACVRCGSAFHYYHVLLAR